MFELEPRIEMMQHIALRRDPGTVYGEQVSPADAAAYVAVWTQLNEGNRAKLDSLDLDGALEVAWRTLERVMGGKA